MSGMANKEEIRGKMTGGLTFDLALNESTFTHSHVSTTTGVKPTTCTTREGIAEVAFLQISLMTDLVKIATTATAEVFLVSPGKVVILTCTEMHIVVSRSMKEPEFHSTEFLNSI